MNCVLDLRVSVTDRTLTAYLQHTHYHVLLY